MQTIAMQNPATIKLFECHFTRGFWGGDPEMSWVAPVAPLFCQGALEEGGGCVGTLALYRPCHVSA